jgi:hypothetical protein
MIPNPIVSIKYDDGGIFELELELDEIETLLLFFIRIAFFAALLFME